LSIPDEYKIKVPIAVAKFGNIVKGDAADKFIEFVLKQENRLDIEYGKKEEQKGGCK
jgi:hypothetical protein